MALTIFSLLGCSEREAIHENELKIKYARFQVLLDSAWFNLDDNYELTHVYVDSALSVAIELNDSFRIIKSFRLKAKALTRQGKLLEGVELAHKTLKMAQATHNEMLQRYLLQDIGTSYMITANYEHSLKYLFRTMALREQHGDPLELASVYSNIGLVYYKMRDNDRAIEYYNKVIALKNHLELALLNRTYTNLGLAYCELDQYDTAFLYFNNFIPDSAASMTILEEVGRLFAIGMTKTKMGKCDEAEPDLLRSMALATQAKDHRFVAENLVYLGRIYIKQNLIEKAKTVLNRSESLSKEFRFNEILLDVYRQQIILSNAIRDQKSKVFWQDRYIAHSDAIYTEDLLSKIATIQVDFEEYNNNETIKDQQTILDLQQQSIQTRKILMLISLVIVGLLGVIIMLLFNRNKQKKKLNKNLDKLVQERTKELELTYNQAIQFTHELNNRLHLIYQSVRSNVATLKGFCHLMLKEARDEQEKNILLRVKTIAIEIEKFNNRIKAEIER